MGAVGFVEVVDVSFDRSPRLRHGGIRSQVDLRRGSLCDRQRCESSH